MYLTESEKQTLCEKAKTTNQKLSEYIRLKLTKKVNKTHLPPHIITDRILLSKVKQSIMMLNAIAKSSPDIAIREKILSELNNLAEIIDPAFLALMGVSDNDSSDLSES